MGATAYRKPRAVKAFLVVVACAVCIVAVVSIIEVALVKASEYRLSHGDGRERTFRRPKAS
jgi:hypothetical protein